MTLLVYNLSSVPQVILWFFSPSLGEMEPQVPTWRKPCGNKSMQISKHAAVRACRLGVKNLNKPHLLYTTDCIYYVCIQHFPTELRVFWLIDNFLCHISDCNSWSRLSCAGRVSFSAGMFLLMCNYLLEVSLYAYLSHSYDFSLLCSPSAAPLPLL